MQKSTLNQIRGTKALETTRIIIRRIMTRNLALKFSVSGLGDKRKSTKFSFKGHGLCQHVTSK